MKQEERVTGGCNNEPNEKINKTKIWCDGVSAHVCVLSLCTCVCARVSSQDSTCAHTHTRACNCYYFIIFYNFSDFLDF